MVKNQIHTIFFFHFKQIQEATKSASDINDAFGPGTTDNRKTQ